MKLNFENKQRAFSNEQKAIDNKQYAIEYRYCLLKKVFILPIAFYLLLFVSLACNINADKPQATMYTCPMPQDSVFSNKPGKCPKCGMDLIMMENHDEHKDHEKAIEGFEKFNGYTCPMPQDSVFSNKPGKCPKCGMDLIKMENQDEHKDHEKAIHEIENFEGYSCPMHPQIHSDTAGTCTICGMQLEKVKTENEARSVSLDVLLKPSNQQVIANVPMVHLLQREEDIEMESYGFVTYDTRQLGVIASNISGRIEKLYIKYRFQKISKGQKIMDVYSPELLTAQENLLFLIKNDPENTVLANAARQKLLLLGMSKQQLENVIQTGKAAFTVSVFSNYSGHIQESGAAENMVKNISSGMKDILLTTNELSLKEGMYVQKGQNIFTVFNPGKAWAVLNIFPGQAAMIKTGDKVRILPEADPQKEFVAAISYIEPFYREGSKTLTARVYFDNSKAGIPIGSQVRATLFAGYRSANWLPEEAVLSLGLDKVVFVRNGESFTARKIQTGIINRHLIQVLGGLDKNEAVAANAQYLMDSESFIKTN